MLLGPKGTGNLIAATRCDPNLSNNCRTISRSACGSLEKLSRIPCSSMVVTESCLPTVGRSRWDQGLTAAEMKRCHWVKPSLVCQVKFTEWTRDDRLRQPVFLGIREDKNADSREGKLHWFAVRGAGVIDRVSEILCIRSTLSGNCCLRLLHYP